MSKEILRLFAVRNEKTKKLACNKLNDPYYFPSKRAAMATRDQLSVDTGFTHVVVCGPDHRRYKAD